MAKEDQVCELHRLIESYLKSRERYDAMAVELLKVGSVRILADRNETNSEKHVYRTFENYLIQQIKVSDAVALEVLFSIWTPVAQRTALRYLRDIQDADYAVLNSWEKFWNARANFEMGKRVLPYFLGIVRNECLTQIKNLGRNPPCKPLNNVNVEQIADKEFILGASHRPEYEHKKILQALETMRNDPKPLNRIYARVIVLQTVEGWTLKEIREAINDEFNRNVTEGAVKTWVTRGQDELLSRYRKLSSEQSVEGEVNE